MSKKITELPAAASVLTTDILPIVNLSDTTTRKATVAQILALVATLVPGGITNDVQIKNGASLTGVSPGTSGNVLTSNGTTWSSQAPAAGGGANPAGSGNEIQYRVNGTTFGAVSGASSNGTKIDFSVNPTFTKAAQVGTLAWTPTTTRTITIPDATDTLVGRATTDTLTNKSISLANNPITDTSAVQYDLVMHDGTSFRRFNKGGSSSVLTTSSGNVVQWGSVLPAMMQPQTNGFVFLTAGGIVTAAQIVDANVSSSAAIAVSKLAAGSAGQFLGNVSGTNTWGNAAAYVLLNSGTDPGSGDIRFAKVTGARTAMSMLDSTSTLRKLLEINGSTDQVNIGASAGINVLIAANVLEQWGVSGVLIEVGGGATVAAKALTTSFGFGVPVGGYVAGSVPFAWAVAAVNVGVGGASTALTAAQDGCPILEITSSAGATAFSLTASTTDGAPKTVRNRANGSSPTCTLKKSGGTGIAVAQNKNAQLWYSAAAGDIIRLTADSADSP